MLNMVCQDLQEESVLQEIKGEMLATGTNTESPGYMFTRVASGRGKAVLM